MTLHRSDEAGRDLNAGERSQEAPPPRTAAFQNHRIHAAFQKTILAQHALSTSRHGKSTITLSEQFHFIANRSLPVLLFSNSDRKLRIGHFQLPIHGVGIENGLAQRYTDPCVHFICKCTLPLLKQVTGSSQSMYDIYLQQEQDCMHVITDDRFRHVCSGSLACPSALLLMV